MRQEFDLHPLAVEDASHGHQRPKVEEYGDSLFVVMQLIEWVSGDMNLGEVVVFAGPNYVLSVRNGAASSTSWACASAANVSRSCSSKARATCCTR